MDVFALRSYIFLTIAITLSLTEFFFSYQKRNLPRISRWPANLAIVVMDSILVKLLLPFGLIGIAGWAKNHNVGIFHFFHFSNMASSLFTFIIFDFAIYFQHVYSHKWNILWIFHRVHHSDPDLDVTSALRFHPIEILYSLFYKVLIVLLIGANADSVLVFEIVLNSMAMFNHANIYIPERLEKVLRLFLVTPQMHLIHHSVIKEESDTNYGFNFSIWDLLFKTYLAKFSSDGRIGQVGLATAKNQKIMALLAQPFSNKN